MTLMPRYNPFNGSVTNQDSVGATVPSGSGLVGFARSHSFDQVCSEGPSHCSAMKDEPSYSVPVRASSEPRLSQQLVNALEAQVRDLSLELPPELPVISTPQHPSRSQTPTSVIAGPSPTFSFGMSSSCGCEVENPRRNSLVRNAPLLPESPDLSLPEAETVSARAAGPTNHLRRYLNPHFSPVRSGPVAVNLPSNANPLQQQQEQLSSPPLAMEEEVADALQVKDEPMLPSFFASPPPQQVETAFRTSQRHNSTAAAPPPPMPLFGTPDYDMYRSSPPLAAKALKMRRAESVPCFFC